MPTLPQAGPTSVVGVSSPTTLCFAVIRISGLWLRCGPTMARQAWSPVSRWRTRKAQPHDLGPSFMQKLNNGSIGCLRADSTEQLQTREPEPSQRWSACPPPPSMQTQPGFTKDACPMPPFNKIQQSINMCAAARLLLHRGFGLGYHYCHQPCYSKTVFSLITGALVLGRSHPLFSRFLTAWQLVMQNPPPPFALFIRPVCRISGCGCIVRPSYRGILTIRSRLVSLVPHNDDPRRSYMWDSNKSSEILLHAPGTISMDKLTRPRVYISISLSISLQVEL